MKALIAMSGGVDSSVAALLTKNMGYDCTGCMMRLYDKTDLDEADGKTCCSLEDAEDARSVANKLKMPFYVFNFTDDFKEKIIDSFIECYENGRTPNPCIECNKYMKFDKLFDRAKALNCDFIVTGHYARVEKQGDKYVLKKGLDESKDQSYVLYNLTQEQLSHVLFPLGGLPKSEVRKIASENGFINANKSDSQDICFVPNGDYAKVIEHYSGKKYPKGNFVTKDGKVLGEHKGIINYTIGQRRGLGISNECPLYVCDICKETNTVCLGKNEDLFKTEADAASFNWVGGEPEEDKIRCKVKIRYKQKEQDATVYPLNGNKVHIVFDEPQRAITPGQAAVLYAGDIVLGGGKII